VLQRVKEEKNILPAHTSYSTTKEV